MSAQHQQSISEHLQSEPAATSGLKAQGTVSTVSSAPAGPLGDWKDYGEYRGPPQICDYTPEDISAAVELPHECTRGENHIFFEGAWMGMNSLVEKLVRPYDKELVQTVCVLPCLDHILPCLDMKCLLPLYLRRNASDALVMRQMFLNGDMDVVDARGNFSTALDAGANIGISSVFFSIMYPYAKIVSIEPERRNFRILRMNANAYGSRILPIKAALWPSVSTLALVKGGRDTSIPEWGFEVFELDKVPSETKIEDTLQGVSIPFILELFGMRGFEFLKIDIEGSELELFTASRENQLRWLQRSRYAVVELHEDMRKGSGTRVMEAFESLSPKWEASNPGGEFVVFQKV
eukprot:TRINITY_DN4682_c0_g1_i1.p1 TRINITY_DN4682_c0_g1~~TRINITY_DN4682_c0_g1_i1.p1  ORF type:complete len:349 (-),score=67.18 TRINITY_DN4682_c0_g1_i1:943-1989(-)